MVKDDSYTDDDAVLGPNHLEPGMQAIDGSHYHLEAEWKESQEAFLISLGGNAGTYGLPGTTTISGKVF